MKYNYYRANYDNQLRHYIITYGNIPLGFVRCYNQYDDSYNFSCLDYAKILWKDLPPSKWRCVPSRNKKYQIWQLEC